VHRSFIAMGIAIVLSCAPPAQCDYIVAGNLSPEVFNTFAWEEIGLISPRYNNYNNVSKGQSFIAQESGLLTEIDALVAYRQPPSLAAYPPLRVTISTANAGIPATPLATLTFPKEHFTALLDSSDTRHTFDFANFRVPLVAGSEYMVLFDTPFGVAGTNGIHSAYFAGWPAARTLGVPVSVAMNGQDWQRTTWATELAIEVRAVPEPSAILSMVITVLASSCVRRGW